MPGVCKTCAKKFVRKCFVILFNLDSLKKQAIFKRPGAIQRIYNKKLGSGELGYKTTGEHGSGELGYKTTGELGSGELGYENTGELGSGELGYKTTGELGSGELGYKTTGELGSGELGYKTTGELGSRELRYKTTGSLEATEINLQQHLLSEEVSCLSLQVLYIKAILFLTNLINSH